jgi:hypothetical protein
MRMLLEVLWDVELAILLARSRWLYLAVLAGLCQRFSIINQAFQPNLITASPTS